MIATIIDKEFLDKRYESSVEFSCDKFTNKPISLFKLNDGLKSEDAELSNYLFNEENWNSGQDLLRYLFLYKWDFGINSNLYEFEIRVFYKEDTWIGIIIDNENEDVYMEKWYKSRGTTELITKNGNSINLEEYIDILNKLNNSGLLDFIN